MAIKLITDDGKYAYVDIKLIKPFGEYVNFRISDERSLIVITDIKEDVVGIVMPMRITNEDKEDKQ